MCARLKWTQKGREAGEQGNTEQNISTTKKLAGVPQKNKTQNTKSSKKKQSNKETKTHDSHTKQHDNYRSQNNVKVIETKPHDSNTIGPRLRWSSIKKEVNKIKL